jgi:hypothetical protein
MGADIAHRGDLTILADEADRVAGRAYALEQPAFDQIAQ